MPERVLNPLTSWLHDNLPFFYALALSLWGGFVQYANKVRMGELWSWKSMFLDLVVCSFVGILAFFMCQAIEVEGWRAAVIIAVSAHEGSRSIVVFMSWRDKFIGLGK